MLSSGGGYSSSGGKSWAAFQWQPGLTSHDPNPPLTIETAAAESSTYHPRSPMRGCLPVILAAFQVATIVPLFTSVVLAHTNQPQAVHAGRHVEQASVVRSLHSEPAWDAQTARKLPVSITAVAPVEVPLFSHPYRGEFSLATWGAQTRPKLVQPFVQAFNDPPFAEARYLGDFSRVTWAAQTRPKLIQSVDPPPVAEVRYGGDFSLPLWEAQTRPKLVPITESVVDAPPPVNPESLYGPLASHYAPPVVTPLWVRTLTVEGQAVAQVDNPPFTMRNRQDQPVDLHWIPRVLTGISRAVGADSVDNPPFNAERYLGDFSRPVWSSQARPKLVPSGAAAVVNDPPFSTKKYRGEWPVITWEHQARPKLIPMVAPQADNPPFGTERFLGEVALLTWETQNRPKLVPIALVVADAPPFSAKKYLGEWPPSNWEAQARPKLVPIPDAAVLNDPPPSNPDALYGPLASHYAPAAVAPLWGNGLTVEGAVITPVDDPPFTMRTRQAQPIASHWIPRDLTGISRAVGAESVDNPPFTTARYRGEWPPLTWAAQARPKLTHAIPPPVNDPPFESARYLGDFTLATWSAQDRLKLTPPDGPPPEVSEGDVLWRPIWVPRRRG